MATSGKRTSYPADELIHHRREFLKKGAIIGTLTGIAALGLVARCSKGDDEEISPAEDLMREHGVLNRIMLVYDTCQSRLISNEQFPMEALNNAAQLIKTFIEEYHEKLEEDFLFPRFINAKQLVALVQLLYIQHSTGRKITDQVLQLTNPKWATNAEDTQKLIVLMNDFNRMYRPHEAREDTVLFPALRKIVSKKEYYALGEDFEKKEHELFGKDGFEAIVAQVEGIEKQLGIFDLSPFTPIV
jgi:hemerythrin-like domain-containing protein